MEYDKLSDEDLDKMLLESPEQDYDTMSDEDLDKMLLADSAPAQPQAQEKEASLLSQAGSAALSGLSAAGEFIDTYTGAPTRAAIGAAQRGENPFSAGYEQFGEDPSQAPTGQELAETAGVPRTPLSDVLPDLFTDDEREAEEWFKWRKGGAADVTASGAAGLGLDIAADPTNLVPGKAVASGLKGVKKGVKAAGKAASYVGDKVAKTAAKTTTKVGSTLTGLPEGVVSNYIKKRKAIDKVIGKYGDDIQGAADELRKSMNNDVSARVGQISDELDNIIKGANPNLKVKTSAILDSLDEVKAGIDVDLNPEAIKEIEELATRIGKKGPELGAKDINSVKRFLQQRAKGAYKKEGQIFTSSKEAQKAAQKAGRQARKAEVKMLPETASRNLELQKLHRMQKQINPNLLKEGKSPAALMGAGSGANQANINQLKKLGKFTGQDYVAKATDLATQKSFANAPLLPVDTTGKTAARIAVGYGAGQLIGGPVGGALGAAMTSPYVLKKAIQAGDISSDLVRALAKTSGEITDKVLSKAIREATTKRGKALLRTFEKTGKLEAIEGYKEKKERGKAKWANEGFEKLRRSLPEAEMAKYEDKMADLMASKKGRDTLAQISTLKPGSKAFKAALKRLDKIEGDK